MTEKKASPRHNEERLNVDKLKHSIDKSAITILALAERSGVDARTIARWLGGNESNAKRELIRAVEGALKLPDGELILTDKAPAPPNSTLSWVSKYPDLRGEWELEVKYHDQLAVERLDIYAQGIDGQGQCYIEATLITPNLSVPGEAIKQLLRGTFEDKFHLVFQYRCVEYTECGTGIFKVKADHQTMEGMSVNYGLTVRNTLILNMTALVTKERIARRVKKPQG
ncbi:MAG: helix-turn-helix transcriptional regulator [Gammaproteobacteria bacterium]|nr:helix-turn-helix transcriptional regulator [Gammaproteobacteria bacterium]